MDSFNDVMDAVKAYCKGRVSDASYRVFIQDLNLLNFEGTNIIILEVPNDVVMRFAAARYADLLKEAFASILGFEVELKFVLAAPAPTAARLPRSRSWTRTTCPAGGTSSRLRTSSRGRRTSLRLPPRRPWPRTLRRVQPAVHLRAVGSGQDAPAERHQN